MSANKPDILQIRKYLNGELDTRAMYELERQAQDDPFLRDVIRGMESSNEDHQPKLEYIDRLIDNRVAEEKRKAVVLWKWLSVAASLIIALGIGGWLFTRQPAKSIIATNTKPVVQPDKVEAKPQPAAKPNLIAENHRSKVVASVTQGPAFANSPVYRTDTTAYQASVYQAKTSAPIDELLKKLPGVNVDSNGNVTHGAAVTKVHLNGKAFMGSTDSVPKSVADKIQVIDDYGDQASKSKSVLAYKTVTGKIVDKDNNTPLPGVSILIKGSNKAAMSDTSGRFSIKVPTKMDTLNIHYLGYVQQQVKVSDRNNLKIALQPSNRSLNEVVVGYGSTRKNNITGSVASVSTGDLKKSSDTTVNSALLGKLAGVNAVKAVKVIKEAHPQIGWDAYRKYMDDNATVPGGKTGHVKLVVTIGANGEIGNITILKSSSNDLNQKAISLIKNGPKWLGDKDGKPKQIKLQIKFH